jgi:hypothetical protein
MQSIPAAKPKTIDPPFKVRCLGAERGFVMDDVICRFNYPPVNQAAFNSKWRYESSK